MYIVSSYNVICECEVLLLRTTVAPHHWLIPSSLAPRVLHDSLYQLQSFLLHIRNKFTLPQQKPLTRYRALRVFPFFCVGHGVKKKKKNEIASAAKALLVVGRGNLQRDRPDYGSEMRRARLATGIAPSFCLPRRLNKARATSSGEGG